MKPLAVSAITAVTALGHGLAPTLAALREQRTGLKLQDFETATLGARPWPKAVTAVMADTASGFMRGWLAVR